MEKLKDQISNKLNQLGHSFASNDDAMMDDMADFILSPYECASTSRENFSVPNKPKSIRPSSHPNPSTDDDVIDSIDSSYFIEEDFEAIDYELKKLPDNSIYVEDLERERLKLKSQLQIVSKKISALILEKSVSYSSQMDDISVIRDELKELIEKVQTIRRSLCLSRGRTTNALRILANEKKKKMLYTVKATMKTVKTLYETEYRLRELIEEGKFPMAIELCARAQEAAHTYRHFSCVSDLMTKLSGTTTLIERELDSALSALCLLFDQDKYAFVYSAYCMLGKQESASTKLTTFFTSSLESSAHSVLLERARVNGKVRDADTETYERLVQLVNTEDLTTVMKQTGLVLCKILSIYHIVLRFHIEEDERLQMASEDTNALPGLFQSSLVSHLPTVFSSALSLFYTLLSSHDLSHLKFDHILEVVDMTNRFAKFGRLYFGDLCTDLLKTLEKQTLHYFTGYHRDRMDELRMFLENEIFTLCPVPYQFTIFDLQEFQFLKESRSENGLGDQSIQSSTGYTVMPSNTPNPFGKEEEEKRRTFSHTSSISSDLPTPTTHRDLEPNYNEPDDHVPPNLCNTALNLLRFFGRYIRMSSLLPSISEQSIPAITQLFNYFFFSVCWLFGRDGVDASEVCPTLRKILIDVRESCIAVGNAEFMSSARLPPPSLSSAVQLQYPDQLFASSERIMAVESLEFVARQLDLMRPVIESLFPEDKDTTIQGGLDTFYSQVLSVVPQSRTLIFSCIASKALKYPVLVQQVSHTSFDLRDLQSQHSGYVDFLLQDLDVFSRRLDAVSMCVSVSETTRGLLWDRVVYYAFHAIVQGYSESSSRCSNEGRALMQLDIQHLISKIEGKSGLKPVPHVSFVEGYIKAFYLPEASLEQWIHHHSEYSSKQLTSLLGTATHVSKKTKTRIMNALSG